MSVRAHWVWLIITFAVLGGLMAVSSSKPVLPRGWAEAGCLLAWLWSLSFALFLARFWEKAGEFPTDVAEMERLP